LKIAYNLFNWVVIFQLIEHKQCCEWQSFRTAQYKAKYRPIIFGLLNGPESTRYTLAKYDDDTALLVPEHNDLPVDDEFENISWTIYYDINCVFNVFYLLSLRVLL